MQLLVLSILMTVFLSACGGGGGGSSTTGGGNGGGGSTTLNTSVGNLSAYQLTAGNASNLNGSTKITFKLDLKNAIAKIKNFFIPAAIAQSVSNCSSGGLAGTSDTQSWSLIGITTSTSSPACVKQIQDAGSYLILSVSGVTDTSGNTCDLAIIAKGTGNTTCIHVSLPNRAISGAPTFFLDPSSGQTPGQLTLNGKYFFVGFYTDSNPSAAYSGFLRLDFTGATPTAAVIYADYGAFTVGNSQRINGNTLFFAPYYPMENGDLMFTQFNLTGSASQVPQIGVVQTYYVIANPTLVDPTKAVKALVNQTVTTPTDGYSIDMVNSPIATVVSPLALDITEIHYNNDAFADPAASTTNHSFFLNVDTNSSSYQPACVTWDSANTSTLLLKGVVDANGNLTLSNYGGSNLGNGLGANSLSNDVTPDGNGNLYTLLWKATSATTFTVTKYIRPLVPNPTCSAQVVYTGTGSGFTTGSRISIQTIRSADTVFMQNFVYWGAGGGSCQLNLGCPLSSGIALGYDIATGVVAPISLSPLNGSQYFVYGEYSASTADRIYFRLKDNSTSPASMVTAQLTTSGFQNIIRFKTGVSVPNSVVNGGNN